MSMDDKVGKEDQDQYSYENAAKARRVIQVNSAGTIIKTNRLRENILGSAGTGVNPTKTFTLTTTSAVDIVEVFLSGTLLIETSQYTINNTTKLIVMVGTHVADAAIVSIFYNV